ncbi:thioredoxin family protein [Nibribacter ruber]|nr:thioredoxin family protein [Nibribacter ruber]
MTYSSYRTLVETLAEEGSTTGLEQTDERIAFTKLNLQRMKRVEKQFAMLPEMATLLQKHQPHWRWLLLVESWCGDGAQTIPAIASIAQSVPTIELLIVPRDENQSLMNSCLTNGSRAIPKLICENHHTGERLFTWGPRPAAIQEKLVQYKAENPGATHEEYMTQVHGWYAKDRSAALQQDLLALMEQILEPAQVV